MHMGYPTLILASTSPYRRALFERLRLPFSCRAPQVPEDSRDGEPPRERATRLAAEKACAVSRAHPEALVIGSDQVASLAGRHVDKPGSAENARQQLRASSGQCVHFDTAVALAQRGQLLEHCCTPFEVRFRALGEGEIERYVALEQPFDCAGSFRWECLGITLFEQLRGDDPTALEGLPLIALSRMLRERGISPLLAPPPD